MRPADARRTEHAVGNLHVPPRQLGLGGVADEVGLVGIVAADGRVADGVVDAVLEHRIAHALAVERLQAVGRAVLAVLFELVRVGHVGVVLAEVPAVAARLQFAQLAERAERAQRRVVVHRHGVRKEVLLAVHPLVLPPEVGGHRRALHRGRLAVLLPEAVHARVVVVPRLRKVRLGEERRRHGHPVAVVRGREVVRVSEGAQLGVVAPCARRGWVAHEFEEGLAREAEVSREARLDDARAQGVLVLEVRRGQVGGRHGVPRDVIDRPVPKPIGGVVAAHVGARRLLGYVTQLRPELEHLLARELHALRVGREQVLVRAVLDGRRRRRRGAPVEDHLVELPLERLQVDDQVVVGLLLGAELLDEVEDAREDGLVERERAAAQVAADVLRGRVDVLVGIREELLHRRVDDVERVTHDGLVLRLQLVLAVRLEEVLVPIDNVAVREADGLHPLVVAALPQALVVPRAAKQRRKLGELRLALAVLDVLVRNAQPLHQLDEVEWLGAEDLDVLYGLHDLVDGVDDHPVDRGLGKLDQRDGHLVEDHHEDVGRGALLELVGQVVDPRGLEQHEDLAHARHRVEAERRDPERGGDVLPQRANGAEDRLGDVVGARRVAQRARGRRGQPAGVLLARHVVALVGAVELVPARHALLRNAVDLRLLHEHARVDQADGADAHAVHVVLVDVDQDAAQKVAVDVRLGGAAHDGHRRARRLNVVAPRVQVVVVRVGAHARAELDVVLVVACARVGNKRVCACVV